MILTNKHNLPEPLVQALTHSDYVSRGSDISVTSLYKSPRQVQLVKRHDHEIVKDVSELFWVMLGNACHKILENSGDDNALHEEYLTLEVNGWKIASKADRYHDKTITDWKITSVWAVLLGDKFEWEAQTNCNAHAYREHGFPVDKVEVYPILRDHQKSKAKFESDYPAIPFKHTPIPLWSDEDCAAYIKERVTLHQFHVNTPDNDLPECSPEERWAKPDTWAVKKPGNKKALRVFESEQEAINYHLNTPTLCEIEFRPGKSTKCESYCDAKEFCNQWKEQ